MRGIFSPPHFLFPVSNIAIFCLVYLLYVVGFPKSNVVIIRQISLLIMIYGGYFDYVYVFLDIWA